MKLKMSEALNSWFAEQSVSAVSYQENFSPDNNPPDDYEIIYEGCFKPLKVEEMQLEVILTNDGYFGLGVETRDRVASRLKVKNRRVGFAAGFEPCSNDLSQLLLFLNLVRTGRIALSVRRWPLIGLGGTRAIVAGMDFPKELSFGPRGWLSAFKNSDAKCGAAVIRYLPWS